MSSAPIEYYNRNTGRVETESVYGEGFLRWTYYHPLGRLALHAVAKRAWFSRWYGWRMDRPSSRSRIRPFIEQYGLDASEFADPPETFGSFNEFFFRRLRDGVRPVEGGEDTAVFPADGRHLGFPDLSRVDRVYSKGQAFDLETFLGSRELAARYREGALVMSRLCPVDYHRFHFPVGGRWTSPERIDGPLCSVNPMALRLDLRYFMENRRFRSEIDAGRFGRVLMLEVGATCVGGVEYEGGGRGGEVERGAEKGWFRFGGSAVAVLFEPGRIRLSEDLVRETARGRELYARVGQAMGVAAGRDEGSGA